MSPIDSVAEWCDGVGHRRSDAGLYLALTLEEASEALECAASDSPDLLGDVGSMVAHMQDLSMRLRREGCSVMSIDNVDALDAALDTAWVALCLAFVLLGNDREKLRAAWAELHRSNVTDKQVSGQFFKDHTGKIKKPATWSPPDFGQFF